MMHSAVRRFAGRRKGGPPLHRRSSTAPSAYSRISIREKMPSFSASAPLVFNNSAAHDHDDDKAQQQTTRKMKEQPQLEAMRIPQRQQRQRSSAGTVVAEDDARSLYSSTSNDALVGKDDHQTSLTDATSSADTASSAFLQPSKFSGKLAAHAAQSQAQFSCASTGSPAEGSPTATTSSALQRDLAESLELRQSFEMRAHIKLRSTTSPNSSSSAAAASSSGTMDVPLMPVSLLRRKNRDDVMSQAEQLHRATQMNKLAQVTEVQPFRCLSCFSVFKASPKALLKNAAEAPGQTSFEEVAEKTSKKNKELNRRRSAKPESIGQRRERLLRQPGGRECCPRCKSKKVQWMVEYVHNSLHTPRRHPTKTGAASSSSDKKKNKASSKRAAASHGGDIVGLRSSARGNGGDGGYGFRNTRNRLTR